MNTTLIKSVDDAIESVHFCGFEKNQIMFRGQVNSSWPIIPSLFRKYPHNNAEARLFESAIISPLTLEKMRFPFLKSFAPIEQLTISQHYNIPTRLLDWTNDILIALFFACYDKTEEQKSYNGRLILAEKSFFHIFPANSLKNRKYKKHLDYNVISDYAKELSSNGISIYEPIFKNPRMRVQDGCFMLFPFNYSKVDDTPLTLDNYIKLQREYVDKNKHLNKNLTYMFVAHKDIDKNNKNLILEELDLKYGISEKSIMIDNFYNSNTEFFYKLLGESAADVAREAAKITNNLTDIDYDKLYELLDHSYLDKLYVLYNKAFRADV